MCLKDIGNKGVYFLSLQADAMNQRHLIRFLLGLTLLEGGRVSCQSPGDISTKPASLSGQSVIPPCEPDTEECKDQIMAHEGLWESQVRSGSVFEEITIQKLKKDGQILSVPDADNFYQGETTFGKKAKFRKIFESVKWRPFWWQFDLRGFAEMCFLDPHQFDGTNYELQTVGTKCCRETLLGLSGDTQETRKRLAL